MSAASPAPTEGAARRPRPARAPLRGDARSGAALALHYALVFAPIYATAWFGLGPSTLVFYLWFGLFAHGALLAIHEAAHKLLLQDERRNEWLARWVIAPLFLADFESFRRRHWAHHKNLGTDEDPKYTYRIDVSGPRFGRFVVSTLTLFASLRRVLYQVGERSEATRGSLVRAALALVVVQGLFALTLLGVARLGHPASWREALLAFGAAYVFVYGYGLASLGVLVHALRGIIEHQPCDPGEPREGEAALRNFADGFLERWIFGSYGFADHATHHRWPQVPYYQLPALTREAAATSSELAPVGSHSAVLRRLVRGRS